MGTMGSRQSGRDGFDVDRKPDQADEPARPSPAGTNNDANDNATDTTTAPAAAAPADTEEDKTTNATAACC